MIAKPLKALTAVKDDGALSIQYIDIETIRLLPDNIKAHDTAGIRRLIEKFGFVNPIGINKRTGHDIFGNGRLEVLLQMLSDGAKRPKGIVQRLANSKRPQSAQNPRKWYVPTIAGLDFDENDETVLAAGMNRVQELGGIDNKRAYEILSRLKELDPANLETIGYEKIDLDRIKHLARFQDKMADAKSIAGTFDNVIDQADGSARDDFVAELNKKWRVKKDTVWQIGNHRLACIDAAEIHKAYPFTDPARLCFTSPPYDSQRNYEGMDKDFTSLMIGMSKAVFQSAGQPFDMLVNLGVIYEKSSYKEYWIPWQRYMGKVLGQEVYAVYVWDKLFGFPGNYHGRLCRAHEYVYHFSIGHAQANKWIETTDRSIKVGPKGHQTRKADASLKNFDSPETIGQAYKIPDSVIRIYADMSRGIHTQGHPAVFPVELAEFVIKTWSDLGDCIVDPFAGSGSTVIAAENLDRKCFATEISPNYCALILERMTQTFPNIEVKQL